MYILNKILAHLNCHFYKRPWHLLNFTKLRVKLTKNTPANNIKAKGWSHTKTMNVHNMLSHCFTPMCAILVCLSQRLSWPDKNSWWKYDIEAKGKNHRMHVSDTSSHSDTIMCQMWLVYVEKLKCCGLNPKPCQKPFRLTLRSKVNIARDHEFKWHIIWSHW